MKKIKIILSLFLLLSVFIACNDLEVAPPNILTDEDILGSEAGVVAFLSTLYYQLPVEDFKYRDGGSDDGGFNKFESFWGIGTNGGEVLQGGDFRFWEIKSTGFKYWPYSDIRNANYFIETMPQSVSGDIAQDKVDGWLGEAYFCRAYYYFGLVKRYGGIPIIDGLQDPNAPLDELQVPRDKEEAVYDFIGEDLDKAINLLPATNVSGRATSYAAAALKSRVMLYAGTIAKYGGNYFEGTEAQVAGLVGIPAARANDYFQKSYDAAKLLDGVFDLYEKDSDKCQNYVDLFFDSSSPENILIKDYKYENGNQRYLHNWDCFASSRSTSPTYQAGFCPTVELLEYGGKLKVNDDNGNPILYDSREAFLESLTPRQRAIALFPGEEFRDAVVDIQAGLYEDASHIGSSDPIVADFIGATHNYNGVDYPIIGYDGMPTSVNPGSVSPTGLHLRKYNNYQVERSEMGLWMCTQHWITLRYAEVLLNRAEAAFELGTADMIEDARRQINKIRERGGDDPLATITLEDIRNERRFELAFENHAWWDLRRWRIGETYVREKRFSTVPLLCNQPG